MMILDEQEVADFARRFHDKYEEESILADITNREYYEQNFANLDYSSIGRRVGLPISIINGSGDPVQIISSFCRDLRVGERNYVARKLNELAEEHEIETVPLEDLSKSSFDSWHNKLTSPDQLILPLDSEYHSEYFETRMKSQYDLDVSWIPLNYDIEHGFVYNRSKVTIVQKWFNEMEEPQFEYHSEFDKYSQNRSVALYFGKDRFVDESQDDRYQDQVDFLFFTSLSTPLVRDNAVLRLEPQKELESSTGD